VISPFLPFRWSIGSLNPLLKLGGVLRKSPRFSNKSTSIRCTSATAEIDHYPSPLETPIKEIWIMPNWLCVSTPETFLSEAESLFGQRKFHSGLAYTDCCLHQSHYPPPPSTSQPFFPIYYCSKIDVQTITNAERISPDPALPSPVKNPLVDSSPQIPHYKSLKNSTYTT